MASLVPSAYELTLQVALVRAIFALGVYVSMSAGLFSFVPVASGAAGAFTVVGLSRSATIPLPGILLVGVVVGAALAWMAWMVVGRLETHFLAIATLALVLVGRVVILNLGVTGGVNGSTVAHAVSLPATALVVLGAVWVVARTGRSPLGSAMRSVRLDPEVSASLAIDPRMIRRRAFVMGGALGGLAGVLDAATLRYIGPDTFHLDLAFTVVAAVVLGGSFHWSGPLVGACVMTFLPELVGDAIPDSDQIVAGLVLLAVVALFPRGVMDPARWGRRLDRRSAGAVRA